MNSEDKRDELNAIVPESKQTLIKRSGSLISRGLRDVTDQSDSTILELGKALTSCLQLDQVIGTVMAKIDELFRINNWSLLLLDEAKQELFFELAVGKAAQTFKDVRVKLGEGIAGWVAEHGETLAVSDTKKDSRFVTRVDGRPGIETQSVVAVPLRFNDRCLGVIELINCFGPDGFSKRDLVILEAIAGFAGVAIENARHVRAVHEVSITNRSIK